MDGDTICDDRARDVRIWQINSQNFRVRKILKNLIFPGKCDLYHSIHIDDLHKL